MKLHQSIRQFAISAVIEDVPLKDGLKRSHNTANTYVSFQILNQKLLNTEGYHAKRADTPQYKTTKAVLLTFQKTF